MRRPGPPRCVPGRCGCRSIIRPARGCFRRCSSPPTALHHLLGKRKPFLTAKRMLTNQTFRDVFKADNLNIDQRLKITSLTFLFTDLKGSTALYERVGDLAAFDLVRAHFHALLEIISSEKGAVVKTIGDAVMATFIRPEHATCRQSSDALGDGGAQCPARHRRPDRQDRNSRRPMSGRDAQRAAGLFRPDRQYRSRGCRACRPRRRSTSPAR